MANRIRGRREGSIYRRSNGRWRCQVSQEDGHRLSHDFKTKTEAQAWLRQMQGELEQGFDYRSSKILLNDFLLTWLDTCRISLRPKTVYDYGMILKKHVIPFLGDVTLKDLTPQIIEKYYAHLIEIGIGVRTVRLVHSIFHRALEKAVVHRVISYNPSSNVTLPRYQHREMQVWDEATVNRFLATAVESRFIAFYVMAIKTGMRLGELLGLRWSDLQWENGRLYIQRQLQVIRGQGYIFQEPKTRAGRRTIQLSADTLQALREHRVFQLKQKAFAGKRWVESGLIFTSRVGTPLDPSNVRLDFYRVIEKAGVPRVRLHDLRHSAASLMLSNGIPVSVVARILGHSRPSITLDIYSHLYAENLGEVAHLMDQLVSPPIRVTFPSEMHNHISSDEMIDPSAP